MRKNRIVISFISLLVYLIFAGFIAPKPVNKNEVPKTTHDVSGINSSAMSSSLHNNDQVRVIKVIDGDTVEIEGGKKLRYIGINTPDTKDPRQPIECFGQEAYLKNKELVEGKVVRLEKDVSETDKYGRLLRYVYLGNVMINELLVKEGYAYASSYPPDVKYQDKFRQDEHEARETNKGLWDRCKN